MPNHLYPTRLNSKLPNKYSFNNNLYTFKVKPRLRLKQQEEIAHDIYKISIAISIYPDRSLPKHKDNIPHKKVSWCRVDTIHRGDTKGAILDDKYNL